MPRRAQSVKTARRAPPAAGARQSAAGSAAPSRTLHVVFATPEAVPFSKTGGLADVSGALPAALAARGVDVTLVVPLTRSVRDAGVEIRPLSPATIRVPHGPFAVNVGLEGATLAGGAGRVVFIRYDPYFDRPELYGADGADYPDNAQRFSLFARAVPLAARALRIGADLYHINDWQTSLIAPQLKSSLIDGIAPERTLLTIHNIAYQGVFWKWDLPWTGLSWDLFTVDGIEYYGNINFLKAGIAFADAITTVSPTYAREIQSVAGAGLESLLRGRSNDFTGIVNGIDTSVWNPSIDRFLPHHYSLADLAGKAACKAALREELGLGATKAPLIGAIGRLVEQKGISLLIQAIDDLTAEGVEAQYVVLGRGDEQIERALNDLQKRHPRTVSVRIGFDEALAHLIEAGCDMFAMPSHFEPCGLNQLYSMAYGTVPIVRRTGGLADTVIDVDDRETRAGTGFVFDGFDVRSLAGAVRRAVDLYADADGWAAVVRRGMGADWSWDRSAASYLDLYRDVLTRPVRARRDVGFPKSGFRP